jgi:hypothetical protein
MKKLQLIDMTLLFQVAMGLGIILVAVGGWLSFWWLTLLLFFNLFVSLLFPMSLLLYSRKFSKKAFYNPIIKKVEVHIGRSSTPMKLAKTILEAVKLAKKMNQDVLFFTNHFPEERLKEKWGEKIQIKPTNLFRKILFYIPYYFVTFGKKKGNRYPLIECKLIYSKL